MNSYRVVLLLFLIATALSISFGAKNKASLVKKEGQKPEGESQHAGPADQKVEGDSKEEKDEKKSARKGKPEQQEASGKEQAASESKSAKEESNQKPKNSKTKKSPAPKNSLTSASKRPASKTTPKAKSLHTSSPTQQDKSSKTVISQPLQAEPHPPSFWSAFAVYMLIFSALCFGLKYVYFPDQPLFLVLVDLLMLGMSVLKSKKVGYTAPEYTQEIDDYNSITVGYNEEQGRQLFWEKNSVEGI